MKEKISTILTTIIFLCVFICNSFAMDTKVEETNGPEDDITITLNCDESFSERIEIYFNGIPRTALWYDSNMKKNGYSRTISIERGVYKLMVLSSTDLADRYSFSTDESIDTSVKKDITIEVSEDQNTANEEGDGEKHYNEDTIEANLAKPSFYDFSNGSVSGKVTIKAINCAAIDSLIYTLVGEGNFYEIELDNEHLFEAEVILPIGSYYESSSIKVKLDQDAYASENVTFLWAHKNNPGFFGNYYDITENVPKTIDDLTVYMINGNSQFEVNSEILFHDKLTKNLLEAKESHLQKELESEFPGIYNTSPAETETIAAAKPVEEETYDFAKFIPILAGLGLIAAAAGILIWIRKKR